MEISAKLTGDAQVKNVKGKDITTFTLVIIDYMMKAGKREKVYTYIECAYWQGTKIAEHLTKSTVVTVSGRIGINAYKTGNGEFKANLVFHTDHIKILAGGKKGNTELITTDAE